MKPLNSLKLISYFERLSSALDIISIAVRIIMLVLIAFRAILLIRQNKKIL